jgi:hypothetical protein
MDGKALVARIAFLIIGFSLLNVIFWGVFVGARGIVGNVVGLVINVVLALFLISGQNWARWFMTIRCGFGAILSFSAWTQLGNADFSFFSIIRLWLLFAVLFSAAIGAYLLFSKRANEHFNPSSGF